MSKLIGIPESKMTSPYRKLVAELIIQLLSIRAASRFESLVTSYAKPAET